MREQSFIISIKNYVILHNKIAIYIRSLEIIIIANYFIDITVRLFQFMAKGYMIGIWNLFNNDHTIKYLYSSENTFVAI